MEKSTETRCSKHTPGPWAVELPYGEPGVYVTAAPPRGTNPLICRMSGPVQTAEAVANARLIAAAPDLLAALENLRLGVVNWISRGVSEEDLEAAEAAINKAKGE